MGSKSGSGYPNYVAVWAIQVFFGCWKSGWACGTIYLNSIAVSLYVDESEYHREVNTPAPALVGPKIMFRSFVLWVETTQIDTLSQAQDIFHHMKDALPPTGSIKSVTVYPSEYGKSVSWYLL